MNESSTPVERIEKLMHKRRLRWADLGRALKVSSQVTNNWRRRGAIPAQRFAALAELFGCSMEYIATGKGEKEENYDVPPTREEWATLSMTAREFIGGLVHKSADEKLADKDFELLKSLVGRLAAK